MFHYHKCYKNNNNDEDIIGQLSIIVANVLGPFLYM